MDYIICFDLMITTICITLVIVDVLIYGNSDTLCVFEPLHSPLWGSFALWNKALIVKEKKVKKRKSISENIKKLIICSNGWYNTKFSCFQFTYT